MKMEIDATHIGTGTVPKQLGTGTEKKTTSVLHMFAL
jgi:hypothetical protein